MCKVSVVIPIYNVEKYVKECVGSVVDQTLEDIEIICVDDASTDGSLQIVQEFVKNDSRIKVIAYDVNRTASQARKDGALQAKGEYIMFLDGDDYLEPNACEELYNTIVKKNVDILHFGTIVRNEGYAEEKRIQNLLKLLEPYPGELRKESVFTGCFIEKKYRFSIWNKIYRSDLCKKAFEYVKDGRFPKAQDLYAFFIICYFAESYCGVEKKYYNYRFGTGITGNEGLSLPQLERYCSSVYVADAIKDFITEQSAEKYMDIVGEIRKDLLHDCVGNWFSHVSAEDASSGFDILCRYWDGKEIVANLCEKHFGERKLLAEKIFGARCIQYKAADDIKTIGIFYHRYALGGVQRVISLLIPLYIEMGYGIVLFTDEYSEENEYPLPDGVKRVVLPSSLTIKKEEYFERAKVFLDKVQKYHVDVMCYQAASSKMLLFDMVLLQMNQIPVIVTVHEVAFQNMLTMNDEIVNRPSIYRLADCVTVLSRVEEKYWRCLGVNARYIPNPIGNNLIQRDLSTVEKNAILWIGRLDVRTKCCLDVVNVMKYVIRHVPDAKLLVLGNEVTPGIVDTMKKRIAQNGLERNVILCGYDKDVDSYYRCSELHLLTSVSETFPMVIAESKAYGMPLVMYELPFVEFSRDERGMISVPQGDSKMMGEAVVKILKNEEYKKQLQKEAHESLKDFLEFDLKSAWHSVFSSLNDENVEIEQDETTGIMLRSLLHHYSCGVKTNKVEKHALHRKINRLRKVKTSMDYRLGHTILYIPRMLSRGIKKLFSKRASKEVTDER